MRVTLIVAAARNNVIGRAGALPWRLSDDLKRFKALTLGKPIVMGRKTFESIGKPLPGRTNIVISRDFAAEGTLPAPNLPAALDLASHHGGEAMVIGGARVFVEAIPLAGRIHFTRVEAEVDGDVFFPRLDPSAWRATSAGAAARSPRNDYSCRFFILDRHG